MNKKLTLFLLLGIVLILSSCQALSDTAKKISESRAERTSSETSVESTSEKPSSTSAEEPSTTTTQTTTATSTTTQEKKAEIVERLELKNKDFSDDIVLPVINMELLDTEDAKKFNAEINELATMLLEDKSKSDEVSADFEYFDSADILSLKVNINKLSKNGDGSVDYFSKAIVIDKKEKRALSNDEIFKLAGADKNKFLDIYYQFTKAYLYQEESLNKELASIEQVAGASKNYLENDSNIPMYFDGELLLTVPKVELGSEEYKYIDLVYGENFEDFTKNNELGAFSKFVLSQELSDTNVDEIDLSIGENTKEVVINFNKSASIEIERMKYDYASDDVLLESVEYSSKVKKGDRIIIKLDSKIKSNEKAGFYSLVLNDKDDYYVMDLNKTDTIKQGIDLEYVLKPTLDYKKKIELANSLIKNAVNLLGVPMARINQLYGYEYKLNPLEEGYFEMVFEDERYPVLLFDGKDDSSTVQRVFSDFSGYNIINEINVGMTVKEVEEILGGYKNKVIAGNELYESYTVFKIDNYDVYVYGKDSDLISFGMAITYEKK